MNKLINTVVAFVFCLGIGLTAAPAMASDNYYETGAMFYTKGDYSKAMACFQEALRNKPNDANCLYFAAATYQKLGNLDKARKYYEAVVRVAPATQAACMSTDALKVIL